MNPTLGAILQASISGLCLILGGIFGTYMAARKTAQAQIESKKEDGKTLVEVTHINAQSAYADDLREDIKANKAEIADLRQQLRDANQHWIVQSNALIDAHSKIRELEYQITLLKDENIRRRQDCEDQISRLQDEITSLKRDKANLEYELAEEKKGTIH